MTNTMSTLFALLAVVAQVVTLTLAVVWLGSGWAPLARARASIAPLLRDAGLWAAWAVATTAMLGSLYYSEVAHFVPCKLCWYQRIAMYPLVVLLLIAAVKDSREIARASIPLALIGAAISSYHYLLERFPSLEGGASCDPTAPCTIVWVWRLHYLSIPGMALTGFLAIAVLLWTTTKEMPHAIGEEA